MGLKQLEYSFPLNEPIHQLGINGIIFKVLHNNDEIEFTVHDKNKKVWIYPNNDDSLILETEADMSISILLPLTQTKPGDILKLCILGLDLEHETGDEDEEIYYGYKDGHHYGLVVPDLDYRYTIAEEQKTIQFLTEPVYINDLQTEENNTRMVNSFIFKITDCDKEFMLDYIFVNLTWCSDEKEYARDIAVETI